MTHEELLLAKINEFTGVKYDKVNNEIIYSNPKGTWLQVNEGYRAVLELHKPTLNALPDETCFECQDIYPCSTIQVIEKELK